MLGCMLECSMCRNQVQVVVTPAGISTNCQHMIQCNECRDYFVEKLARCERCASDFTTTVFPSGCSEECPRHTHTSKSSALCPMCDSKLRKESKCCKNSADIKRLRATLRNSVSVLVQDPRHWISHPSTKSRPCSHYNLCQYCQSSIIKGHRSTTSCKSCRGRMDAKHSLESFRGEEMEKIEISPQPRHASEDAQPPERNIREKTSVEKKMSIQSLLS